MAEISNSEADERYRVLEELGRGGMGIVYKVHDRELDEVVAIKLLDPELAIDAEALAGFKRELILSRRIRHPNVAQLYHFFRWRGTYAIEQAFIAGRSLDTVLRDGPASLDWIVRVLRCVASGLDAAHRVGVLHRDIKPSNIVVHDSGGASIVDFGVALLAGASHRADEPRLVGSPGYMSPEQILEPDAVDHRTDIYSLGAVLFEMATGSAPFTADRPHELFRQQLTEGPPVPSERRAGLPLALDRVVVRCLAREPVDRYSSAMAIHRDLVQGLDTATASGQFRHPSTPARRGRVLVADDDADTRLLIETILARLGVETLMTGDGRACVELAERARPDLVLLDLGMPYVDGREALRLLKSRESTHAIPVVMLTGVTDPEEMLLSKDAGAALFLNKPVQADVLELVIDRFLAP